MATYVRFWRALTNAGFFLFAGSLGIFLGITKDMYMDWDTNYAIYALIGGAVLLVIGIIIFARNISGKFFSVEDQEEDFVWRNYAPEEKRKYLAVGAIYVAKYYNTIECLRQFNLRTPKQIKAGKEQLKDMWGISDERSAKETLDWLYEEGHRGDESCQSHLKKVVEEFSGHKPVSEELAKLAMDIRKMTYTVSKRGTEYIDPLAVSNCTSMGAWDFIRGIHVSQVCYSFGYLSEKDTWASIERFVKMVKKEFNSWEELAVSFVVGQYIWSGNVDQSALIESFSSLFSNFSEEEVTISNNNIWKKYAFADL